ncbi:MAG: purine-nucleoside phosphorylase [Deltaproteobacteria bacterium]|nr:MAG: purine-nucleoside phosphorylase [Deltaproteobacteria bacterium]
MWEKLVETRDFLLRYVERAEVGIIAGTGLDPVTEGIEPEKEIPYEEIPNFPRSTVEGHKGILKIGRIAEKPVIAMEGRFHLYEGYSPQEVVFPVRVMSLLGIRYLLICSAAGGLNPLFDAGDLMLITDHINLTGRNPLLGSNIDELGVRFPDMTEAYDPDLVRLIEKKAADMGIILRKGVYVGVLGPSLETRAETRFLRMIGADAVGMSTVMEDIAAVHAGIKVMGIAVITNMNLPDRMEKSSIEEIISVASKSSKRLALLCENIIKELP